MVLVLREFALNFKGWRLTVQKGYLKEGGREEEWVGKWRKERGKEGRWEVVRERKEN